MDDYAARLDMLAQRLPDIAEREGCLSRYSAAGIGGPADLLIVAKSRDDLLRAVTQSWSLGLPLKVFGGLTNCLISDDGVAGVVILNLARNFRFEEGYRVFAESGAIVVQVSREVVRRGWGGLTWAVGLPGTIGGAVVNNAGAFGGEISRILASAEVVGPDGAAREVAPSWFDFRYRCSRLKGAGEKWVVLSAVFQLREGDQEHLQAVAETYTQRRRGTQPPGKTLGSTFKNPEGDSAGRLIEAAGLKGVRVGGVSISTKHANFFINDAHGTAADYQALIRLVQDEVRQQFCVSLEPEIEFVGRREA